MLAHRLVLLLIFYALMSLELIASCCSSASNNGIGRLASYERAYVEFFNDAHLAIGSFNSEAKFKTGVAKSLPYLQLNHELHAMARLANFFLPFVKIPINMSISKRGAKSSLGNISIGARWPLFDEARFQYIPALSLLSSVQIPSGLQAWWMGAGLVLDKSVGPVNLSFNYGLSFNPTYFSKLGIKHGIKHSLGLQGALLFAQVHRLSIGSALSFQGLDKVNGQSVNQTSKYQIALSASYAWAFHSHLTINTGLGAHIPVSYLGKNSNSEIFANWV